MDDNNVEESEQKLEAEVAPALIAVHPAQQSVSVAVGSDLRVFNLQDGSAVELIDDNGGHKGSIRSIRYSKGGDIFVSAGDDKLVKIWDASWRCIQSVFSEKRVNAVAISNDGIFVCFADKFGVVYVVDIRGDHACESSAPVKNKAVPILAHYCSIITRLEFSPNGQYIVSADRDFKIRVTLFPKNPLHGAHEIQSFCLGHTEYVSCLAFASCGDSDGILVSGSGDATVRLWDYSMGLLLDTCDVGAKVSEAGLTSSNGKEDEVLPAVTDLCASRDGSLIAVAIQSLPGIMLLNCNLSSKTLSIAKVVRVTGETFIPTSIGAAHSTQLLWIVMGASSLQIHDTALLARLRVVSGFSGRNSGPIDLEPSVLENSEIPGGEPLLQALQGKLAIGEEAFSAAADAVKTSMHNLLIKKQYSAERREFRKRGRNDKKDQK